MPEMDFFGKCRDSTVVHAAEHQPFSKCVFLYQISSAYGRVETKKSVSDVLWWHQKFS